MLRAAHALRDPGCPAAAAPPPPTPPGVAGDSVMAALGQLGQLLTPPARAALEAAGHRFPA